MVTVFEGIGFVVEVAGGSVDKGADWKVSRENFGRQSMIEVVLVNFLTELGW